MPERRHFVIVSQDSRFRVLLQESHRKHGRDRFALTLAAEMAEALLLLDERPCDLLLFDAVDPAAEGVQSLRFVQWRQPGLCTGVLLPSVDVQAENRMREQGVGMIGLRPQSPAEAAALVEQLAILAAGPGSAPAVPTDPPPPPQATPPAAPARFRFTNLVERIRPLSALPVLQQPICETSVPERAPVPVREPSEWMILADDGAVIESRGGPDEDLRRLFLEILDAKEKEVEAAFPALGESTRLELKTTRGWGVVLPRLVAEKGYTGFALEQSQGLDSAALTDYLRGRARGFREASPPTGS